MTLAPRVSDRLWPVLLGLVALVAGALVLESYSRGHAGRRQVVEVREAGTVLGAVDDDAPDGEDGEAAPRAGAPLDADHAAARVAARRGLLDEAIAAYGRAIAAHPDDAGLRAELGYWLLVARAPERARTELERAAALRPDDAGVALNLGVALSRLGDRAGAERELRRALALRPGLGGAQLALGTVLRRLGRIDEAVALLERAARTGGNEDRARAEVALGRTYLAAGRQADAGRAFDRAIAWAPARVEIRVGIGRSWLAEGGAEGPRRATAVLARAAELAPDLAAVHGALARAREKGGDAAGAEAAYERALRLDPGYRYARRRLLRIALDRRDFDRARLEVGRLLEDGPDVPEHHFLAGLVASREGHADEARRHYRTAIEAAKGDYPEAFFNLGRLERAERRFPEAIAAYEEALRLRPGYAEAENNLGLVLADAGRHDEARATYERALARDPGYAAAWLNLGELELRRRRHDDAIAAFRKAAEARPGYSEAQLNLGVALARSGRHDEAIASYRALLATQPRYVNAWFNLGFALESAGRPDEARTAYLAALELEPDHEEALRKLAGLEVREGAIDDAARAIDDLLDHVPGDRQGRLAQAELRRRQGDLFACAAAARSLVAEAPGEESALRLLELCRAQAR